MNLAISKYSLVQEQSFKITVSVSNPTEVKSTLSTYTTYQIRGTDKKGQFECTRRYSQFDLVRQILLKKWPGCYIPAIPEKKVVGNSDTTFIENRRHGLESFCQEISYLPHLWYSDEFEIFLRKGGDVESSLKAIPTQNHEDIIKKYDQKFIHLRGKSIDTNTIAKVLEFNKYLRKAQPLITYYKEFLVLFSEAKRNNYDHFSVLYNYILPEYQKTCLANYLGQNVSGKLIYSDENDERLASFVSQAKQIIAKHNFDQLLLQIDRQQREINSFLEVYKQHAFYEKKVSELKDKEKELEFEQQKLNMGKQGIFKSIFKSNIEQNKKDIQRQISVNKDFITTYSLLSDLITMLLGFFEIDRFRQAKIIAHNNTIHQIAKIQLEFIKLQKELCNHILDNHNLI